MQKKPNFKAWGPNRNWSEVRVLAVQFTPKRGRENLDLRSHHHSLLSLSLSLLLFSSLKWSPIPEVDDDEADLRRARSSHSYSYESCESRAPRCPRRAAAAAAFCRRGALPLDSCVGAEEEDPMALREFDSNLFFFSFLFHLLAVSWLFVLVLQVFDELRVRIGSRVGKF